MAYDRLVMLDDLGKTFTAKANATISGGTIVSWASGGNAADVVGSGATGYAWDDVVVGPADTQGYALGIALTTATSGNEVAFAMKGMYILPCGSTAISSGGVVVDFAGYGNAVLPITGSAAGCSYRGIGRALTAATAVTGFTIVALQV
mgnify:CR=1 FL=1